MAPTFQREQDVDEPVGRAEVQALRGEIAELHQRVDALLAAVEILAHDHYRPLGLPEAKVTSALNRAKRRLTIYIADLRRQQ
jgi:hypothetical protein